MMKDLLDKIFDDIICNEEDGYKMEERIGNYIDLCLMPYKEQFSDEDMEKIRDCIYAISTNSEREAFQLGVKYTIKMLLYLFTKS